MLTLHVLWGGKIRTLMEQEKNKFTNVVLKSEENVF